MKSWDLQTVTLSPHAPEILEHCKRIGRKFGLYDVPIDLLHYSDAKIAALTQSGILA